MNAPAEANTRLTGRWLTLARILWIVLAVGYLALWLASLPGFYERVSTLTIEPYRLGERVIFDNTIAQREAQQRGLSIQANAVYYIARDTLQVLVYYIVAILIVARATNRFGLFTAFVLLLMSTNAMTAISVTPPFAWAFLLVTFTTYFVWPLWLLWLALFPNGRVVPRRAFWPFVCATSAFLTLQVISFLGAVNLLPSYLDMLTATAGPLWAVPIFGYVLFSQIYRYLRIATLAERQQMKWFLFGIGLLVGGLVVFFLARSFVREVGDLFSILFLIFPITVAIAILRYRLFDVDLLIRRTLQYSLLSGVLALVYFGGVVVLQSIFTATTGQSQSPLVTVLSTLAIAALFFPLRKRVQDFIDKRFFRKKYDAAKTLADFAATARDETDLDKLTARLVEVVDETMRPEAVQLWLKDSTTKLQRGKDAKE